MTKYSSIIEYKREAKKMISTSLEKSFEFIESMVEQNNDLYNEWILQKGQYNDLQNFDNKNVYSKNELDQSRNKIRSSLLNLIDSLSEADFESMQLANDINDKLERLEKELEDYEKKTTKLLAQNEKIDKEKQKLNEELQVQREENINKINQLVNENLKLKSIEVSYLEYKERVEGNKRLIMNLQKENESLNKQSEKIEEYASLLKENSIVIDNLKKERKELVEKISEVKKQENQHRVNKKYIDELREENQSLKRELTELRADKSGISYFKSKRFYLPAIGLALFFIPIIFLLLNLNSKLEKEKLALSEEVEKSENESLNLQLEKAALLIEANKEELIDTSVISPDVINNLSSPMDKFGQISDLKPGNIIQMKREYRVKLGERVYDLLKRFDMTEEEFRKINPSIKNLDFIKYGFIIFISEKVKIKEYVVNRGETISSIAKKTGMSDSNLRSLNNLTDPNKIKTGQRLKVVVSERK